MKKLIFLTLVLTLVSCGQNNVADTNTAANVSTEKVETKTAEIQTVDSNATLRSDLEKMSEEFAKTGKYASFADFEKATGLKLGNDAEVLPEDKENAGVGVGMVKNDFVLMSTVMGKGGRVSLYQLKDGKMEYIIGGNGDAPIEQCEKLETLNLPVEFSRVKEQFCNYAR